MKERIEYIDLAKGICILLVVMDHISDRGFFADGNYPMNEIFEQLRMPLYFVLSGLFFKDYAGGIKQFLLRKTNRIIIPFLFFTFTLRVLNKGVEVFTGEPLGNVWSALWFLRCLFEMNIIFAFSYYLVRRFLHGVTAEVSLAALMLIIGVSGYFVGNLPLNVGSAMTCMPFLWFGYLLNRRLSFFQLRIRPALAVFLFVLAIITLHFTYQGENYFYRNEYSATLLLLYFSGALGTIGILLLSRVIKRLSVVSYVGRYSIIVLCVHQLIITLLLPVVGILPIGNVAQGGLIFLLAAIVCMACCWLFKRYIPWLCAQKDLITI